MKKHILLLTLCSLLTLVLLSGCRKEPESLPYGAHIESSSAQTTTRDEDSSVTNSGDAPQAKETSSSAEPVEEHSVTGIIDDVSMGQVFVQLDSGQVVPFDYTTADIGSWDDTKPGAKVQVYYTGTINGTDTSNIKVTRIENV